MSYGVRKVNEFIIRDGRALILTQNVANGITQEQWDSIADGTLYIDPSNGDIKYKKINNKIKEWTRMLPENFFDPKSIKGNLIADYTITREKYAPKSVHYEALSEDCIQKLDRLITTENFMPNSIDGKIIKDNTTSGTKMINNSIDGIKIKDYSIDASRKLMTASIDSRCYKPDSVTGTALAPNSITEDKINYQCISERSLYPNTITSKSIKEYGIGNISLASGCIEYNNLSNGCVRSDALTEGCVGSAAIADYSITSEKIRPGSIGNKALAPESINTNNINRQAVTIECLDSEIATRVNNAVIHDNGTARVYGTLQVDKDIMSSSNKAYSITGFKVYNPVFADFAEGFEVTEKVSPGDIVETAGEGKVKKASKFSKKVIGVVSDEYGICLGAEQKDVEQGIKAAVGLIGKINVKVVGKVKAGDFIVCGGNGIGYATEDMIAGMVIGKALEDKGTKKVGKVLCLVNIM